MKKKIISIVTLLCLLVSCLPMSAFAESDTTPPIIGNLSFNQLTDKSIQISVEVIDNQSGPSSTQTMVYQTPETKGWKIITLKKSGDIFVGTLSLGQWEEEGEYTAYYIDLRDAAGNNKTYGTFINSEYYDLSSLNFTYDGIKITHCDHVYTLTNIKEAKCGVKGERTYTCGNCGHVKTEIIYPINNTHNYKWSVTKEATCTEKGIEEGKCTYCGDKITRNISQLGHSYYWEIVENNGYGKNGIAKKMCNRCEFCEDHILEGWDKVKKNSIMSLNSSKTCVKVKVKSASYTALEYDIIPGCSQIDTTTLEANTKYQIKYSTKSSMSNAKNITKASSSIKISNLKKNTKYYVQVRNGYEDPNGKMHWSSWSTKKSIKTSR